MSNDLDARRAERAERVQRAIRLEKPDRVPFAPKLSAQYAMAYGIPMYAVLKDLRNIIPGIRQCLSEIEVDLAWAPIQYPMDPMQTLLAGHIHFPGPEDGIDLFSGFQIQDGTYLLDDEFDEFVFDPTHFFLTKLLPRKFRALDGLKNMNFQNPTEYNFLLDLSRLAAPETQRSMQALLRAAQQAEVWKEQLHECVSAITSMGYPQGPSVAQTCPFDMFTDNYRGIESTMIDLIERPEQLLEAIGVCERICNERVIANASAAGAEYVFIPLHNGADEFMSRETYLKFYWRGLRSMMMKIIENGMTPYVFCEGKYNTRLDILKDVPRGKVVYMFEEVDLKKARQTLGDTACICGNMPAATLAYGTRQQVVDETRRMLEDCAGDGGFIMDCSISLDNAKRENLIAWYEATMEYGKY